MHADDHEQERFEARLRAHPPALPPSPWRGEILQVAARAGRTTARPEGRNRGATWRAWLWPHPLAHAGLAAAWVLTAVFRLSTPLESSSAPARTAAIAGMGGAGRPTPSLREEQRLLAELLASVTGQGMHEGRQP